MLEGINWLHVLVAALSSLVVGMVWYNPKVFGNAWMREIGTTEEEARARGGNMAVMFGMTYVYAVIAAIYTSARVNHVPEAMGFEAFKHGFVHGLIFAFYGVLPIVGTSALYEGRGWRYVAISVGFWAVTLGLIGGILNVWH